MTGNDHYVPGPLRARACRVMGHEPPAAFGLDSCPVPFPEVLVALLDRVEELERLLAVERDARDRDRERREIDEAIRAHDEYVDGLGNR